MRQVYGAEYTMNQKEKASLLSGIQPTGELHIGHYLGVLNNFKNLQEEFSCHFMIANLHAVTLHYKDYSKVHDFISNILSDWLAIGIDPEKSVVFVQSDVPEHAELNLILSMYTPVSWLKRNPTYKDKKEQVDEEIDHFGFLGYPVLQAADILLYEADIVPIGEDQLPHLELTREIARRFNHFYGDALKIPKAKLSDYPKVLGTDGRKMSKSYGNTINLSDTMETLSKKVMKMKTDPARIKKEDFGHPEVCPVYSYYSFFAPQNEGMVADSCRKAKIGCVECKSMILESIQKALTPFREKKNELKSKTKELNDIFQEGAKKARNAAGKTLQKVKEKMKMKQDYAIH